jgi:hypothetical protein
VMRPVVFVVFEVRIALSLSQRKRQFLIRVL